MQNRKSDGSVRRTECLGESFEFHWLARTLLTENDQYSTTLALKEKRQSTYPENPVMIEGPWDHGRAKWSCRVDGAAIEGYHDQMSYENDLHKSELFTFMLSVKFKAYNKHHNVLACYSDTFHMSWSLGRWEACSSMEHVQFGSIFWAMGKALYVFLAANKIDAWYSKATKHRWYQLAIPLHVSPDYIVSVDCARPMPANLHFIIQDR